MSSPSPDDPLRRLGQAGLPEPEDGLHRGPAREPDPGLYLLRPPQFQHHLHGGQRHRQRDQYPHPGAHLLEFHLLRHPRHGADLQFVDKDGTYLYHEVVEWDKANKTGKVWVKVPQVDGNSTTDYVTLYYGCSTCTGNPYAVADSVWRTYAGVFHLKAPETQAKDAADRLPRHLPGQPGLHGRRHHLPGAFFDGTTNYVQTTVPTTAGTRTFSAWIYPRSSVNTTISRASSTGT